MNFNDSVSWYLDSSTYNSKDFCFFSQVIGSADSNNLDYKNLSEFYRTPTKLMQEFPIFSVERLGEDRIILTIDLTQGYLVPASIALISENVNGERFLVAKIVTNKGSTKIDSSYERIFSLPLPYMMKGGVKEYPSFFTSLKRKPGSPMGGEKVSVGEHHHSVSLNGSLENFPDSATMNLNFIRSAQELNWIAPKSTVAMTLNERGTSDSDTLNAMGFKDSSNLISSVSRVVTQTILDSIVNYLEVLVMANNKIQILGKQIPTIPNGSSSGGFPGLDDDKLYVLTSDSVSPTSDRQLKAIPYDVFRKSIVGKYSNPSGTLTTYSAINYVKSSRDFTLISSDKAPQIAIVVNTNAYPTTNTGKKDDSALANSITVTYNGSSKVSIPAQGVAIFETQKGGKYEDCISLTQFTQDYLSDLMKGNLVSNKLRVRTLDIVNSDNTYVTVTVDDKSMVQMSGVKE